MRRVLSGIELPVIEFRSSDKAVLEDKEFLKELLVKLESNFNTLKTSDRVIDNYTVERLLCKKDNIWEEICATLTNAIVEERVLGGNASWLYNFLKGKIAKLLGVKFILCSKSIYGYIGTFTPYYTDIPININNIDSSKFIKILPDVFNIESTIGNGNLMYTFSSDSYIKEEDVYKFLGVRVKPSSGKHKLEYSVTLGCTWDIVLGDDYFSTLCFMLEQLEEQGLITL